MRELQLQRGQHQYCAECGDDAHPGLACRPESLRAMKGVRELFGEGAPELMAFGLGAKMVEPDVPPTDRDRTNRDHK